MMKLCRSSWVCFVLSVLTAAHCLAEEGKHVSPGEAFAKRLAAALKSMRSTEYQHKTDIDEETGRYHCDCSGLFGYFLRQDHPEAYLALTGDLAPWRSRPLAATFYETFDRVGEEGDGLWQQVPSLLDARPGDLIAWRRPELAKGKSTGHVMMLAGQPKRDRDGRVRIRVIDSTSYPHGNDTRDENNKGFGAGEMWFVIDQDGGPTAYHQREKSRAFDDRPITIGRLQSGKAIAEITHQEDQAFIGLPESKASKLAKERGLTWRVIMKDNEPVPLSLLRYNRDRLNAVLIKGKVVRARRG